MKPHIPLLLAVILLTACSKSDDNTLNGRTAVTGRLLDASTLEPIAGGTVTIKYGPNRMDTLTDEDGAYNFDFKQNDKHAYYLTAEAEQYFGNDNVGVWGDYYPVNGRASPVQRLELNRSNNIDIKLPPKGYIKYHLEQVNPYSGSIKLNLSPRNPFSTHIESFNGSGLNTTYFDIVPGETYIGVRYTIIRDGDSIQAFNDSVFVPRFDTLDYTIEF